MDSDEKVEFEQIKERRLSNYNVSFVNFSFTKFIAAILYFTIAIVNFSIFGFGLLENHDSAYGSWLFLGGPSWSWPLGFPHFLYALILLLILLFKLKRITIKKTFTTFNIREKSWYRKKNTKILEKDIEAIRMCNNRLGPQWIWTFTLIQYIMLFRTAISILNNPYQQDTVIPSMMFFTIITGGIALLIMIIYPNNYLEIATKDKLYELWFSAPMKQKEIREKIAYIFDLTIAKIDENGTFLALDKPKEGTITVNNVEQVTGTPRTYYRVFLAGFILIWAIYSLWNYGPLGEPMMYLSFIYSFILFFKGQKQDFSDINDTTVVINHEKNFVLHSHISLNNYEYHRFNNTESIGKTTRFAYTPITIDAIDLIILAVMVFYVVRGWIYYLSMGPIFMIVRNVPSGILELYIIGAIFFLYIRPIESLKIEAETIKGYNIHMEGLFRAIDPQKIQNLGNSFKYRNLSRLSFGQAINYYGDKFAGSYQSHKDKIIKRLLILVIPAVLSVLYSVLYLLPYY